MSISENSYGVVPMTWSTLAMEVVAELLVRPSPAAEIAQDFPGLQVFILLGRRRR